MRVLLTILTIVLISSTGAEAQRAKHRLADRHFQEYNFSTAKEIYMNILRKKPQDLQAARRASACYRNMGEYEQGELLMVEVVKSADAIPEDMLLLADIQKLNKHYDAATGTYEAYLQKRPDDVWVREYVDNPDWAKKILRDSIYLDIADAGVNSAASDFSAIQVGDEIFFSSGRSQGKGKSTSYAWNDQSYLNLFSSSLTPDSTLTSPRVLQNDANTRFHEGTVSYDDYNKTLYFTRNQFYKGKKKRSKDGTLRLAIFSAKYENGELGKLKEFKHNDAAYSVGHPCIADSGRWIIFASDRPGGMGGTDLWMCKREEGGEWDEPENLGPRINTAENEMFPYLMPDSTLYFASNGHPGLGGLDIFSNNLKDTTAMSMNFGYPANGPKDDFGLIFLGDSDKGFFTSNREGGHGDDDIYAFVYSNPDTVQVSGFITDLETGLPLGGVKILLKLDGDYKVVGRTNEDGTYKVNLPYAENYDLQLKKDGYEILSYNLEQEGKAAYMENVDWQLEPFEYEVHGLVTYGPEQQKVPNANVILYNEAGEEIDRTTTDENGEYMLLLEPDRVYTVRVQKDGFMDRRAELDTKDLNKPKVKRDLNLFKLEKGAIVRLDNIYYDYNSSHIRDDAALELDKIVTLMEQNPTLKIELSSHTDSRGTSSYNRWLSDRRAKNAADYVISKGVAKKRIVGKGYGEDKLINRCKNGVKCSDQEHQDNRRTEFKVLDI